MGNWRKLWSQLQASQPPQGNMELETKGLMLGAKILLTRLPSRAVQAEVHTTQALRPEWCPWEWCNLAVLLLYRHF